MKYQVEISKEIPNDNLEFLAQSDYLIQQSASWVNVVKSVEDDENYFIVAKDENDKTCGMLSVFLHENQYGNLLISVPSFGGYGGVIVKNDENSEEIHKLLLTEMIDFAKKKNCVLATISTPPFFEQKSFYDKFFQPEFIKENFYHFFNLKEDFLDSFNSKQRNNFKRNMKIAMGNGLHFEISDNIENLENWHKIHKKRMNEILAKPIDLQFFKSIFSNLEFQKTFWFAIIKKDKQIICGGIFIGNEKVVDIFMLSADSDYFKMNANTFLIYNALDFFKSKNIQYLNFQSSPSEESGTFNYKKNWAAKLDYHRYLTKITGDISKIKKLSVQQLKANYGTHYVLPYNELESEK